MSCSIIDHKSLVIDRNRKYRPQKKAVFCGFFLSRGGIAADAVGILLNSLSVE